MVLASRHSMSSCCVSSQSGDAARNHKDNRKTMSGPMSRLCYENASKIKTLFHPGQSEVIYFYFVCDCFFCDTAPEYCC